MSAGSGLAQKFEVLGTKLIREIDCPNLDPDFTEGYHLEVYLAKSGGVSSSLAITDYAIDGKNHAAMPDVPTVFGGVTTSKFWLCSPNPSYVGDMVLLRIRLSKGAETIPTLGANHTLTLYYSDASSDAFTIAPDTTDIWMPYVHIADNLQDLTVYVGNLGTGSIELPAGGGLKINGSAVAASLPATTIAPGDVLPLSVSLASPLTEYERFLLEVPNLTGSESAFGSMRALKASYGTTLWSYNSKDDPGDMDRHHMNPDIPGRAAFRDEPTGGGMEPQTLADMVEASWQGNPSRVVMNQYSGARENQVYAGMNDIQMTHYQDTQLELALHLTWPHPSWYLPQTLWARTENAQNPTSRENWYRPEFIRREVFEALGHGSKVIHWFIHQNLWEQGFYFGGGSDMHRGKQDLFFQGAVANPVTWDRAGRVSAMLTVLEPFVKNSAPAHTVLDANNIELNTLVTPEADAMVVMAVDKASDLQEFYRASAPSPVYTQQVFENVTIEATVPSWLTADRAWLVDMYEGVSELTMTKVGDTVSLELPELREAAAIVLGTAADGSTLESRWNSVAADFATANYGDDGIGTLTVPVAQVLPNAWLHRLASSEKTYSLDVSPDGTKILVGSGHFARLIDSATRQVVWEESYTGRVFFTRFAADGSLFYVSMNLADENIGSYTGTAIKCYNLAGNEQWSHDSGNTIMHMETGFSDNGVAYSMRDSEDPTRSNIVRKLTAAGGVDWTSSDLGWSNYPQDLAVLPDGGVLYQGFTDLTRFDTSGSQLFGGSSYRDDGAYNAACAISADGKLAAFAGNSLRMYKDADGSGPSLLGTQPYLGRNIREIEILGAAPTYHVAAGTCDGVFKIFRVDTSIESVTEVAASTNPRSMVSDIEPLHSGDGFVMAREIFGYSVDTMWRWRDEVLALDLTGAELWRSEGRWRPQPYMTELHLDDSGERLVVLAGSDVRLVETDAEPVANTELPEEPLYYLPPPWQSTDVGAVDSAGYADFSPITQAFTVYGAGNWWNRQEWDGNYIGTHVADEFHFTYLEVTGDVTITARISDFQNAGSYCLGGLMVRETLDPGSKYYAHLYENRQPWKNKAYIRSTTDAAGFSGSISDSPKDWLRIVRSGDSFSCYISDDGVSWGSPQVTQTVSMDSTVYVGLVANADNFNAGGLTRVSYEDVDVQAAGVEPFGAVRTSLRPVEAIDAGAQWKVDGETDWLDSNAVAAVSPGQHSVVFKFTHGFRSPDPVTVSVPDSGWYDSAIGTYIPLPPACARRWEDY